MKERRDNPDCFGASGDDETPVGAELQEIFSRSNDAVFAMDSSRRIVYRNEVFVRVFRQRLDASPDRRCHEVVCGRTPDGRPQCHPGCSVGESLVRGATVTPFELMLSRPDAAPRRFIVGAFPLSPTFGAVVVCMLRPTDHCAEPERQVGVDGKRGVTAVLESLTSREREILDLLAEGYGTKRVASRLDISCVTARNHICHIFGKLGVHSRIEAVSLVYRHRLG